MIRNNTGNELSRSEFHAEDGPFVRFFPSFFSSYRQKRGKSERSDRRRGGKGEEREAANSKTLSLLRRGRILLMRTGGHIPTCSRGSSVTCPFT